MWHPTQLICQIWHCKLIKEWCMRSAVLSTSKTHLPGRHWHHLGFWHVQTFQWGQRRSFQSCCWPAFSISHVLCAVPWSAPKPLKTSVQVGHHQLLCFMSAQTNFGVGLPRVHGSEAGQHWNSERFLLLVRNILKRREQNIWTVWKKPCGA